MVPEHRCRLDGCACASHDQARVDRLDRKRYHQILPVGEPTFLSFHLTGSGWSDKCDFTSSKRYRVENERKPMVGRVCRRLHSHSTSAHDSWQPSLLPIMSGKRPSGQVSW